MHGGQNEVINILQKWRIFKGGDETSKSAETWKMGSEVQWCEVMILGEMYYYGSYVYWTVHHCNSWIKDQLHATCNFISLLM